MKRYIKSSKLQNVIPETGTRITVSYNRNPFSSNIRNTDFGQELELKGEYMNVSTLYDLTEYAPSGWESGYIEFRNPLVLEHISTNSSGWKKTLSDMYDGKTGKELTDAIKQDGYDAIITIDSDYGSKYGDYFNEVVNISGRKHAGSR